jgi:hypothetical protein
MLFQKPLLRTGQTYGVFLYIPLFLRKGGRQKRMQMCLNTKWLFGINCGRQFMIPTKMTSFQPNYNLKTTANHFPHDR